MASSHRISLNVADLAALQTVVNYYEKNVNEQSGGTYAPTLAWRPIESVNASAKSSLQALQGAEIMKQRWQKFKSGAEEVNNTYKREVTDRVNNAFASFYQTGKSVERTTTNTVGPLKIVTKNTINAMANAKTPFEAVAVAVSDCIPCDVRLEAVRLIPDLSFLDELINTMVNFTAIIKGFTEAIMGLGVTESDFCLTINMLNFTCLPDFNALALMLSKGINLSINLPSIQLSPIGNLASMILMPILATIVNMLMSWVNLVLKPVDCILQSLQTLANKFKFEGNKIANQFSAGISVTGGQFGYGKNKTQSVKIKKSTKLDNNTKQFFQKLDNTAQVAKFVKGIEQIKNYIKKMKAKIMAVINKIRQKAKAAMNNLQKFLHSISVSIQEVMKLAHMLLLIVTIKDLFSSAMKSCGKKEQALEETKKSAGKEVGKNIPGAVVTTPDGTRENGIGVTKRVYLPEDEARALGFNENDRILMKSNTTTEGQTSGVNNVLVESVASINLNDCFMPNISRSNFESVNQLVGEF